MKIRPFVLAALLQSSLAFMPHRAISRSLQCRVPQSDLGLLQSSSSETESAMEIGAGVGVANKETGESTSLDSMHFVNDGPFSWMGRYLDLFGMTEGKKLYGAIPLEARAAEVDANEVAKRRAQAAVDMMNIDIDERERRNNIGNVLAAATSVYVLWAALYADDGGLEGHLLRFLTFIPLGFAAGFKISAKAGL
mmetsp:Transcript_5365/g.7017  ORF Transcript_5365/g.7017 Transcript_5365/m.7017 type:complete len:194 (-) Transcript_5365:270-851(-)